MAKTRLAKKRRVLRAREHQLKSKLLSFQGEPKQNRELVRSQLDVYADAQQPDPWPTAVEQPARAKCTVCSTSQKVRKDGTFGKHGDCAGEGTRWDAAA